MELGEEGDNDGEEVLRGRVKQMDFVGLSKQDDAWERRSVLGDLDNPGSTCMCWEGGD